ncbi:hypothetical protein BDK51DRAFT_38891, partial [Blyttiomyces helicus]
TTSPLVNPGVAFRPLQADITHIFCGICAGGDSPVGNRIVLCDTCHTPFHQLCHEPHVTDADAEDVSLSWYCAECEADSKVAGRRVIPEDLSIRRRRGRPPKLQAPPDFGDEEEDRCIVCSRGVPREDGRPSPVVTTIRSANDGGEKTSEPAPKASPDVAMNGAPPEINSAVAPNGAAAGEIKNEVQAASAPEGAPPSASVAASEAESKSAPTGSKRKCPETEKDVKSVIFEKMCKFCKEEFVQTDEFIQEMNMDTLRTFAFQAAVRYSEVHRMLRDRDGPVSARELLAFSARPKALLPPLKAPRLPAAAPGDSAAEEVYGLPPGVSLPSATTGKKTRSRISSARGSYEDMIHEALVNMPTDTGATF